MARGGKDRERGAANAAGSGTDNHTAGCSGLSYTWGATLLQGILGDVSSWMSYGIKWRVRESVGSEGEATVKREDGTC